MFEGVIKFLNNTDYTFQPLNIKDVISPYARNIDPFAQILALFAIGRK